MKKFVAVLVSVALMLGLCSCSLGTQKVLEAKTISVDDLMAMDSVETVLTSGGVSRKTVYGNHEEGLFEYTEIITEENGILSYSEHRIDENGGESYLYFTEEDPNGAVYRSSSEGNCIESNDTGFGRRRFGTSLMEWEGWSLAIITAQDEANGMIMVDLELTDANGAKRNDVVMVDPERYVIVNGYTVNDEKYYSVIDRYIRIGKEIQADDLAYKRYMGLDPDLITGFITEDMDGTPFALKDCAGYDVIMINFWEPWCGPCVGEMPDLEKLFEKYSESGLLILGVFSETGMDEDAKTILKKAGITYPVLRSCSDFDRYQTGYVPTTVFLYPDGSPAINDPIIGSKSYGDWEKIIVGLLNCHA